MQDIFQGSSQLFPGVRQFNAYGGAAPHHLYGAGYRQALRKLRDVLPAVCEFPAFRRQHAAAFHDHFGHGLIHGHAAAERPGAGIGHAHKLQGCLYLAVLSVGPVEAQKDAVRQSAYLQHILSQTAGAFEFS